MAPVRRYQPHSAEEAEAGDLESPTSGVSSVTHLARLV